MKRHLLWLLPIAAGAMLLLAAAARLHPAAAADVAWRRRNLRREHPSRIRSRRQEFSRPASQNIAIGSALSGIVLEVYVPVERVGTHVAKGDPLFRVDDRQLKAQLALAQARAASARSQLTQTGKPASPGGNSAQRGQGAGGQGQRRTDAGRIRAGPRACRPARRLRAGGGRQAAAERRGRPAMATGPARACAALLAGAWKPDLAIARAAVEQAEAEVAQISTEIERATVRAPIEGQVLQVNVRAGERVSDQSQQALMVAGPIASPARAGRHRRARHRTSFARRQGRAAIPGQERSALSAEVRARRALRRRQALADRRQHRAQSTRACCK